MAQFIPVRLPAAGHLVLQLFDALNLPLTTQPPGVRSPWAWLAENQRWVGIGLIVVGVLTLINRMLYPFLHLYLNIYDTRMISAAVVAVLLIAGGIRLAMGKQVPVQDTNVKDSENRVSAPEKEAE